MRSARRGVKAVAAAACVGVMTLAAAAGTEESATVFGFSPVDGAREAALEQRFDAVLDPAELPGWLKTLSAEPNNVGAPHDKANAELVAPTHFTASLTEPPVEGDATSTQARTILKIPVMPISYADGSRCSRR